MSAQLKGDTRIMPLPDLLQWIEQSRKSGSLLINGNGTTRSLYFEDGAIIFASSNQPGQRLGEFLTRIGQIDREALEACLLESQKAGLCFTRYLIDRQILDRKTLTDSLRQLAETILIEVVSKTKYHFTFSETLPRIIRNGPIQIAPGPLIMDSLRKLDELHWECDTALQSLG